MKKHNLWRDFLHPDRVERPQSDSADAGGVRVLPETPSAPKRPKYGNQKTGRNASKKEARRAVELRLLEQSGAISNLREQVWITIIPRQVSADGESVVERAIKWRADFTYDENNVTVWEDAKGFRTPDYIIKRKLLRYLHGIVIRET